LLHWYRNGEDPRRRLPVLSTFLLARDWRKDGRT
jgi:hypothetical protein